MKEFDFDELDKAVTSVMGDNTVKTDASSVAPASTSNDVTRSVPDTAAATTVVNPPVTAPPPASRRTGRFMDVVHPSSDMSSTTKPSREGVAINPPAATAPVVNDTPTVEAPVVATPDLQPPVEVAEINATEPLSSPFLPDAKPDKRPLGGAESTANLESAMAAELNKTFSPDTSLLSQDKAPVVVSPVSYTHLTLPTKRIV